MSNLTTRAHLPPARQRTNRLRFYDDSADQMIVATARSGHRLATAEKRIVDWSGDLDRLAAFEYFFSYSKR